MDVGTQAMDMLVNILEIDRSDAEITGYALDALCNVMSNEPTDEGMFCCKKYKFISSKERIMYS